MDARQSSNYAVEGVCNVDLRNEFVMKFWVRSIIESSFIQDVVRQNDLILSKDILNFICDYIIQSTKQHKIVAILHYTIIIASLYIYIQYRMGYCMSKQQTETYRSLTRTATPHKCVMLQNPPTLILQMSTGTIEKVPIKTECKNLDLMQKIGPGIFFGSQNKIYLILSAENLSDFRMLQAVHACFQAMQNSNKPSNKNDKQTSIIQPQCAYFLKHEDKVQFIVQSKSLGEEKFKFVDLADLGLRLKDKQIVWQDLEYSEIITQLTRKYSKVMRKQHGISNVIVGTDGSVHLLGFLSQSALSVQQQINRLQKILLKGLFGLPDIQKAKINQLQQKSYFKHPKSLQFIQDLKIKIKDEMQNNYELIGNPSLKFIRDYITAYFYKLDQYDVEIVDALIDLKQPNRAKKLLDIHFANTKINQTVTEESYELFLKIVKIETLKNQNSGQTSEARLRAANAAYFLAEKNKAQNKYAKAYRYFSQCLLYHPSKLDQNFYSQFSQVCRALNRNIQSQSILLNGVKQHPNGRTLHFYLIMHYCDCMKIQQAQKQLMKSTTIFRTLELSLCTAKLFLTKSLVCPPKKAQYIQKSREQLQKIVVQKYLKQSSILSKGTLSAASQSTKSLLSIYHQVRGDLHMQEHTFEKAKEEYHVSKIFLKNEKACGYRLAIVTAAEANCCIMLAMLDDAINIYTEALSYITPQCLSLYDSILGNRAIAKIKKGIAEGRDEIVGILQRTPREVLEKDYNYIFLQNFVKNFSTKK